MMQFRALFHRNTGCRIGEGVFLPEQFCPRRMIKFIILLMLLSSWPLASLLAQAGSGAESSAATAEPAEKGLPPAAPTIFNIGPFPVTNSMLVTWIVALGVIVFAQYSTRKMKDVPDGAQNFWEFLVESLYDFLQEIVGADLIKKTFWFFATI